jgi:hypothetical protein
MTNTELKKNISELVGGDQEILNQIIVLEGDEFADGFIGLSTTNAVVYSYNKLVESLMKYNNWSEDEAIEWLDYNTIRALPYMSSEGIVPIIVYDQLEE